MNQLENSLMQQEQALILIEEQAHPLPGTDQYFNGLKNAIQTQIQVLTKEISQGSKAGSKQYYQGLIESVDAQIQHFDYLIKGRKVISPIQGIVKEVGVEEGAMVTAQSPLLTLTSQNDLEVIVYLLTEDVISVREGMKVQLIQKRKNGDYAFGGTVKAIAPAAEEKISALGLTQQKVKVTITPDDRAPELRSGYALDVLFTTLEQTDKLAVPKAALFPYNEKGNALWVIREGKAVIQEVKKGMENDELAVIEKGLNAGERVIKNPQLEGLEQGKRILIAE
ncbi:efflux RND transporter periplasmic adaptor subunit [Ammoniphilus sp. 3BR4]|uniref:efflux RND transporter periplasmic adaptor subunit n=1 Tax=Ammoniphilus sp. 3BR4 TaxID=3158265 RepID=UPI003466E9E2